jgi:hypothetical protein
MSCLPIALTRVLPPRQHRLALFMLLLASIGSYVQTTLGTFCWFYEGSGAYEALQFHGLVPGLLLVLLGAVFDSYRTHRMTIVERERARVERAMALRAAREINEPLTLIIASLAMTVNRTHPGSDSYAALYPARDTTWRILDSLRRVTEPADLPRDETVALPSLLQAVEGRSIPLVDEPTPARPLAPATGPRPRSA